MKFWLTEGNLALPQPRSKYRFGVSVAGLRLLALCSLTVAARFGASPERSLTERERYISKC